MSGTMGDDDFLSEMADVKPLKQDTVKLANKSKLSEEQANQRKANAQQDQVATDGLTSQATKLVGPHDIVGFKKPGIQEGVYKKLRLAKYDIDGRLDLHRHTVDQARQALYSFIQESIKYDLRCVLVLPGKGGRDQEGKAVLKSHVIHWLEEMDEILAYHSDQNYHGGAGALYVLLRKSDDAKQKNRERHGLR